MDEVEATLYDGDQLIISGVPVLIDTREGGLDAPGWHAHVALSLGVVVPPEGQLRIVTADGRSADIAEAHKAEVEGDRILYVFEGVTPLD